MLASIPVLSLIIVGSQIGRAALITLTRPEIVSARGAVVNFRVDLILPRKQEEDAGLRPDVPLLGLAVAPLQTSSGEKKKVDVGRWRLIMHYYDHTVLSYEISREDGSDNMCVPPPFFPFLVTYRYSRS